ncbi:CAP domain-containing protein [Kamptonema cortianum]|nr:CAP domain-containing protein [Kamptonema cortianum]
MDYDDCHETVCASLCRHLFRPCHLTPPAGAATKKNDAALAGEVLALINRERESRKLPPLAFDQALEQFAHDWAGRMAREDRLFHRPNRDLLKMIKDNGMNGLSENVAVTIGKSWTAQELVDLWMKSDGHRRNLLRADSRICGLGFAGNGRKNYAVFNGARLDDSTKGN